MQNSVLTDAASKGKFGYKPRNKVGTVVGALCVVGGNGLKWNLAEILPLRVLSSAVPHAELRCWCKEVTLHGSRPCDTTNSHIFPLSLTHNQYQTENPSIQIKIGEEKVILQLCQPLNANPTCFS